MKQVMPRSIILAAAIGAVAALSLSSVVRSAYQAQSVEEYKHLLAQAPVLLDSEIAQATRGVMERSAIAHVNKNADAAIAELGEGYAWIGVFENGYKEMVSGRDVAEVATRNLYEGDGLKNYLGSTSIPVAIVSDFGIQIDLDNYVNEDGSVTVKKSLSVFEVRGGKLLRFWAFMPTETGHK